VGSKVVCWVGIGLHTSGVTTRVVSWAGYGGAVTGSQNFQSICLERPWIGSIPSVCIIVHVTIYIGNVIPQSGELARVVGIFELGNGTFLESKRLILSEPNTLVGRQHDGFPTIFDLLGRNVDERAKLVDLTIDCVGLKAFNLGESVANRHIIYREITLVDNNSFSIL